MTIRSNFALLICFILISGCSSRPKLPLISDEEAFKYEKEYLAEYEQLKSDFSDQSEIKWVQPANKKTPCKVYVGVSKGDDRTLDPDYKVYWDGDCKNGYANGLGREFERATVLNAEALAIYKGKEEEPEYFIQTYHLDNKTQEGDINNRYFVETTINEDNFNFDINYQYGFFGSKEMPYRLITMKSPFNDNILQYKQYPNFSYVLYDMSNNEFDKNKYNFYMNYKGKANGFGFSTPKSGATASGEMSDGSMIRRVQLPNSYFLKIGSVQSEINDAGVKALNAQKYALKVKKQYMNQICKESKSVDFMDDKEYKDICNDSSEIKIKIDEKLAQINILKQQKREQQRQHELLIAKQKQAEAERNQEAWNSINQSLKELGDNIRKNTPKTTYTNCNGTYGGVNCTSTTY
ncbi:hypothetical protein MHM99_19685 [Alteromonas sp. MmMcT2-2]|uniref:hypothetical protein n=1 Tax=Alteromonas sp. MmMcT2-2 TaxID=2917732 RepID=UPI001EF3891B|nr:hypothetical protein [Alteromonas sp. MmMcT2-2]MCG7643710.1 hypothetical protein [Alteromonas sp. MmMcT2-2]